MTNTSNSSDSLQENGYVYDFPIYAVRTVKSPSDQTVTTHTAYVNMKDLPDTFPTDVNPRTVNMHTATAKKLLEAVSGPDPYFDIHNRGIVLIAKEAHYSSASMLHLDLGNDTSRYGVLDGGHTYEAIKERRGDLGDRDKFVKLEIIVGDDLDVAALSDARNTSVSVSDIALYNLENRFNFLKDVLKELPYGDDIAYRDNEDKRIPIADILRLMYVFNIDKFPDDSTVPTASYSGKAQVFKDYREQWEKNHDKNDSDDSDAGQQKNIYYRLRGMIPELVNLYEKIELELPTKYKEYLGNSGSGAAFGKLRGVTSSNAKDAKGKRSNSDRFATEFTVTPMDYEIASGYIMPIFGAFRALLESNENGVLSWTEDPEDVWDSIGTKLVENTFEADHNPQMVGKNKSVWQSNYRIVYTEHLNRLVKKLTR
ncbi:abortive phage infection protein [Pseudoscardovia radai]|uniref:Abortive phage infection protein n=1 Tax=Pseudoscardovia radai TaxID=987066 RepID=A0A261EWG9_9BIFI|nr:AIPR family protein [Pseudoscardovia radai]OZG51202.1 abortive phage infection protein [Pseudoscardovia radai]